MYVIKRDGSKEEFNSRKIESAIFKAFKAVGIEPNTRQKNYVRRISSGIWPEDAEVSVEEIQDYVEEFLVKNWFEVGKAYMLYREQHKQARLINDKIKYIHKYSESKESATNLSNTDDNANSNKKNAATLEGEL